MADIFVNTYDENDERQNLVDSLPSSKRNSWWTLEEISATTSISQRELVVLNQEKYYCQNCYYIIGVVTHDLKTEYTLLLDVFDADFKNS